MARIRRTIFFPVRLNAQVLFFRWLQNNYPRQTSATVPRAIGIIDKDGQYTLPVADTTAFSAAHYREAAFDGTNNFRGCGSADGTYYLGLDTAVSAVQTTFLNLRCVDIVNTNLYFACSSGSNGIIRISGLTTAITSTEFLLPGGSNTTDFSVDPTETIIYVTIGNNIQKWQFDGTTWTKAYDIPLGAGTRYMTTDFSGAVPIIYVDNSGDTYNRLTMIVDNGPTSTPVTLATAGVNQIFKGMRFGPASTCLSCRCFPLRKAAIISL